MAYVNCVQRARATRMNLTAAACKFSAPVHVNFIAISHCKQDYRGCDTARNRRGERASEPASFDGNPTNISDSGDIWPPYAAAASGGMWDAYGYFDAIARAAARACRCPAAIEAKGVCGKRVENIGNSLSEGA